MLAVTLLKGRLTIDDYADAAAADPAIDALRARMRIWENPAFTAAHRDPGSPTAANAVRLLLDDGTVSPREEVQIPIGDPRRSDEAAPLLRAKFHDLAGQAWSPARRERVLVLLDDVERLAAMDADVFMDQISG
jgi:2-methylcitrate dehydratase